MKDSAANGQPTDEREAADQEATVQKTSTLLCAVPAESTPMSRAT